MRRIGESTGIIRIGVRMQWRLSLSSCSFPTTQNHKLDAVNSLDESLGEGGSFGSIEVPPG